MAKRVGQKIKMTSIDELLCVPSVAGCDEIEVAKIRPFKDHPFKVLDDEKMHELVESIMLNGVLVQVTVRPLEDGEYEMISGHRRLFAVKEIGLERIPAIVKSTMMMKLSWQWSIRICREKRYCRVKKRSLIRCDMMQCEGGQEGRQKMRPNSGRISRRDEQTMNWLNRSVKAADNCIGIFAW